MTCALTRSRTPSAQVPGPPFGSVSWESSRAGGAVMKATGKTRTENDTFGPIEVPADRLWGAQTQRSLQHFKISGERMPRSADPRPGPGQEGRRAREHGPEASSTRRRAQAIVAAADEVLAGRHDDEFPLVVWQTGSGTQTQHEHERGARQPRERDPGRRARREAPRPPQRRRQQGPVVERRLPHRHERGRGARPCCSEVIPARAALRDALARQGGGLRRHRQDRPHAPAGRDAR